MKMPDSMVSGCDGGGSRLIDRRDGGGKGVC